MKIKVLIATFFAMFFCGFYVYAEGIEVITFGAEEITYYNARLGGSISDEENMVSSYGIEIWSDFASSTHVKIGTYGFDGEFSGNFFLMDNSWYSYRAYAVDDNGEYYYGSTQSFYTLDRPEIKPPEINFNIAVESLESIDFASTPNKFLLNNLILNKPETLQLIAGNHFYGIGDIMQAGGQNIFLNQYFINEYYSDPALALLLSAFDGLVYNREEILWDTATSLIIPDGVANLIYNISPDSFKQTFNSIMGDMQIKRFANAINKVRRKLYIKRQKNIWL